MADFLGGLPPEAWMRASGYSFDDERNAWVDSTGATLNIFGKQGFQTNHGGTSDGEGGGEQGVYDADPLINGVQYRSIPGDTESIARLKDTGLDVQQHPEYGWIAPDDEKYAAAFPDRASDSIFDFGPLLLAAFMVPAIASSLAAAPAVGAAVGSLSDAAIADIVAAEGGYSALPSTGMAGTAAGGGLIGSGTEAVAEASGAAAAPETTLSAGQEAAQSIAQEWGNYVDPWASGNAEAVANSGVAGDMGLPTTGDTIVKAATEIPPTPSNAQKFLNSDTQPPAPVETRTPTAPDSIWDKVWKGLTSPQGTAAAITTIGGIASGIGAAALNRDTMLKKSELDLQNAEALQKFKTDQSRQNMFKGIIGVRPAATRTPIQRLTGGPVYNERGLIRRA